MGRRAENRAPRLSGRALAASAAGAAAFISAMPSADANVPGGYGWNDKHYAVGKAGECGLASTGAMVRGLQANLWAGRYFSSTSSVDGIFGEATKNATKSYQGSNGLSQDGCAGWYTWNSMQAKLEYQGFSNSNSNYKFRDRVNSENRGVSWDFNLNCYSWRFLRPGSSTYHTTFASNGGGFCGVYGFPPEAGTNTEWYQIPGEG